jgi:hypothetical protein
MSPLVSELKTAGFNVQVEAYSEITEADYDISDYFTLPTKEWEAKWTEEIAEDLRDLDSSSNSDSSSDIDSDSSD